MAPHDCPGRARQRLWSCRTFKLTPMGVRVQERQNGDSSCAREEREEADQPLHSASERPQDDREGAVQAAEGEHPLLPALCSPVQALGGQPPAGGGVCSIAAPRGCAWHGRWAQHERPAKASPHARLCCPLACLVQESWRRPKGIDSRVRRKFKGCGVIMPNIGYGSNKKTRHVLPNGACAPAAGGSCGDGLHLPCWAVSAASGPVGGSHLQRRVQTHGSGSSGSGSGVAAWVSGVQNWVAVAASADWEGRQRQQKRQHVMQQQAQREGASRLIAAAALEHGTDSGNRAGQARATKQQRCRRASRQPCCLCRRRCWLPLLVRSGCLSPTCMCLARSHPARSFPPPWPCCPGFLKFVVNNVKDLELLMMHNRKFCGEIAHNVSTLKRKAIVERAAEVRTQTLAVLASWVGAKHQPPHQQPIARTAGEQQEGGSSGGGSSGPLCPQGERRAATNLQPTCEPGVTKPSAGRRRQRARQLDKKGVPASCSNIGSLHT